MAGRTTRGAESISCNRAPSGPERGSLKAARILANDRRQQGNAPLVRGTFRSNLSLTPQRPGVLGTGLRCPGLLFRSFKNLRTSAFRLERPQLGRRGIAIHRRQLAKWRTEQPGEETASGCLYLVQHTHLLRPSAIIAPDSAGVSGDSYRQSAVGTATGTGG